MMAERIHVVEGRGRVNVTSGLKVRRGLLEVLIFSDRRHIAIGPDVGHSTDKPE